MFDWVLKHTQTIRRKQVTNCLSVFDHFVGVALKGFKIGALQNGIAVVKNFNNFSRKILR